MNVKVIPYSSNYHSMNAVAVKELAKQLNKVDLSSTDRDEVKHYYTLTRFRRVGSNNVDLVTKHFVYGFLVVCSIEHSGKLLQSLDKTAFTIFECNNNLDVILFTAAIDDWRWLIENRSNELSDEVVLSALNQIQNELEKQGLSFLFRMVKRPITIADKKYYVLE
jgi:hypothetical protein